MSSGETGSNRQDKLFLRSYAGQTIEELIALENSHRIDSIVLAVEQAVIQKQSRGESLSKAERVVIVIEAMEADVNNGGLCQFFGNHPEMVLELPPTLEDIGCPAVAEIVREAILIAGISSDMNDADIEERTSSLSEHERELLNDLDGQYYDGPDGLIEVKLFEYIRKNASSITLP